MITKAAAQRITGKRVKRVTAYANCAHVTFDRGSRFVSTKAFERDARELREEGAKELQVIPSSGDDFRYQVLSSKGDAWYSVFLSPTGYAFCNCPDHTHNGAGHKCKHIIAAEKFLAQTSSTQNESDDTFDEELAAEAEIQYERAGLVVTVGSDGCETVDGISIN